MAASGFDRGFTVAELVVTATLIGILVAPVIFSSLRFYADVSSNNRKAALSLDSQSVLRKFTDDVRMASGFDASNIITDPSKPSGWANGGSNHVLIVSTPALDSSGNFIIDSSTGKPYKNEIVFYNDGGTLYRRALPNSSATGNAMMRSCPSAYANQDCPADIIMTSNFGDLSYTFYDNANAQTANVSAARSVRISLEVTDFSASRPTTLTNTLRIALRNT